MCFWSTHMTFLSWFCCKKNVKVSQSEYFMVSSFNGALEIWGSYNHLSIPNTVDWLTVNTPRFLLCSHLQNLSGKPLCIHSCGSETEQEVLLFLFCDHLQTTSRCSLSNNFLFWHFFQQPTILSHCTSLQQTCFLRCSLVVCLISA